MQCVVKLKNVLTVDMYAYAYVLVISVVHHFLGTTYLCRLNVHGSEGVALSSKEHTDLAC